MLSTTAYETRKADFLAYKDTLTKEPTGNTKKEYYVGCFDKEGWEFIHTQLETSGTSEEHVPSSVCSCANDCLHSDTNGIYMLTDAQARNLLNHSKVEYVNINTDAYPGTYLINPDDRLDVRYDGWSDGGKDIKLGDDKRPVSVIPQTEDYLYNYANLDLLTDEFGNLLITEVDTFYLPDATARRSTSVVFDNTIDNPYDRLEHNTVGFNEGLKAAFGDFDVWATPLENDGRATVLLRSGSTVGVGTTVAKVDGTGVTWYDTRIESGITTSLVVSSSGNYYTNTYTPRAADLPTNLPCIRTVEDQGDPEHKIYFNPSDVIAYPLKVGDRVYGKGIPFGTTIAGISHNSRAVLSTNMSTVGVDTSRFRYTNNIFTQRDVDDTNTIMVSSPDLFLKNRAGYQLTRHQSKENPWFGINDNTVIQSKINQRGTGKDVDVIVCDTDMWFGHIEFQNPSLLTNIKQSDNSTSSDSTAPKNYIGGNVLKSGYSASTATGSCDLLDLVLDAPYYIDPEFFEANASKRTTRWDGTVVPTDTAARDWWQNNSTTHRSAKFVTSGIGTGTATGVYSFGTITIPAGYTRANSNGSQNAYQTGTGYHGTPCASQAYGRQYGWAYNANKWFLNQIGTNPVSDESAFNLQKVFHQIKPINPKYGTQDPTISSNSWAYRHSVPSSGWYYYRVGNSGSGGVSYSSKPAFFANTHQTDLRQEFIQGQSSVTAGNQMVDAGVIFVCSGGNSRQKLVSPTHPDHDNYYSTSNNTALSNATSTSWGRTYYHTLNRPGMPGQLGKSVGIGTNVTYKTIQVGALDDDHHSTGKECAVSYSNMGDLISCYASADQTLAACDDNTGTRFNRYDAFYTRSGTAALESEDRKFNGTSAACPVACGILATKLEYNRTWTYEDIQRWLKQRVGVQPDAHFHTGTEVVGATNAAWGTDNNNLHGALPTVIWDAPTGNEASKQENVLVKRSEVKRKKANTVWKIEEQFAATSEVSSTLLGIPRAETQLSLFSNVSSYGIDPDEFETWGWAGGVSNYLWESRKNRTYGSRYTTRTTEETQESGISLGCFPAPYSFPFGRVFGKVGLYNEGLYAQYLEFIHMGNDLHDIFNGTSYIDDDSQTISLTGHPDSFKQKFLPRDITDVQGSNLGDEAFYNAGITTSFARIDDWTETWRSLLNNNLYEPVTKKRFGLGQIRQILTNNGKLDRPSTRPGYDDRNRRFVQLQSRRVFRYQPGRISGFTFGLRSSKEKNAGYTVEWGIGNPTDQYIFRIRSGFLRIVRRSTISLAGNNIAIPDGLTETVVNAGSVAHPYDATDPDTGNEIKFYELELSQDNFNGDKLNGTGNSEYVIDPDKVTMWKIEFGWYGAIGVRFYAYVPVGNDECRWVVVHTMVIENQLKQPCLRDSYFRLIYNINITDPGSLYTPQFVYKYGASYYIDGGDEGTSQIYSVSTPEKTISGIGTEALLGITPKESILNSVGQKIKNRKLIIPTKLQVNSDSLSEMKTVVCKACPGFGHVYTPGVASGTNGRTFSPGTDGIKFGTDFLTAKGSSFFTKRDIGAKVISPTIWNAYIESVDDEGTAGEFETAYLKGFTSTAGLGVSSRVISDFKVSDSVSGQVGINTSGEDSPHPIRLSNYYGIAASNFAFTGSKIEIQFVNPGSQDDYKHFADAMVGVTDRKPTTDPSGELTGWTNQDGSQQVTDPVTGLTTAILPNEQILGGEYTHTWASIDADGVETGEAWSPVQPSIAMGIDYRLPTLPSPASGHCSLLTVTVEDPFSIKPMEYLDVWPPDNTIPTTGKFLQIQGTLPSDINYDGGEVAIVNQDTKEITETGLSFIGTSAYYNKFDPNTNQTLTYSFIEISGDIKPFNPVSGTPAASPIELMLRPVRSEAKGISDGRKLFNYNPFPLYAVIKMRDKSVINNISIKETSGDFSRTITPKWYIPSDTDSSVTFAKNSQNVAQADESNTTHYQEVERLSATRYDIQSEQKLRDGFKIIDTVYVGANQTKTLDVSKIFGADRNVITPDNQNREATFIVAKKIDGASPADTGTIQVSLNFKEQ